MKNKLTFTLFSLYFTLFCLASCGDDDSSDTFNIEDYIVTAFEARDEGNTGDPSDIVVAFTEPVAGTEITEYRIAGIKSTSSTAVTAELFRALESDRQITVANSTTSYTVILPAELKDMDGLAFELDADYNFYIMSVGTLMDEDVYVVSGASATLTFAKLSETSTLVSGFRGNGAITLDEDGNLYVSEFGAGSGNAGLGTSAFKITPEGVVKEFVSNLSGPVGNTLDANGNYYVNNGNEGISGDFLQIAPDGTQTIIATINGYPTDILTGQNNDFYIANWTKPVIHHVTMDGTVTNFASDARLEGCVGIAYDDDLNILVGNFGTGKIMSLDSEGTITEIATIPTVFEGFVIGYIDYFDGHIYATGYGSNIIYKVSLDGNVEELAGTGDLSSRDGELAKATFMTPNGIAVDKERKLLYVSQNGFGEPTSLRVIPLE